MSKKQPNQTIITLTLPNPEGGGISKERGTGTLLIQRGNLAHIHQFHYRGGNHDLIEAIRNAYAGINKLQDNPPVIEEAKPDTPPVPEEPTIELPCKKGARTIPMSHLKIIEGETDAVSYRIAMQVGARLIDGKLWDGKTPLRLKHVGEVFNRMKTLTDADFQLFTLSDFAEIDSSTDQETE